MSSLDPEVLTDLYCLIELVPIGANPSIAITKIWRGGNPT